MVAMPEGGIWSAVTSHLRFLISHPWPLIPAFKLFWGISLSRIVIPSVALHLYGTAVSIT